jgi:hypothetical protein
MFWNGRALRALQTQLKSLREEPLEGFRLIINENNLFEWTVGIYGPPDSLYQGGYFKAVCFFKAARCGKYIFYCSGNQFPNVLPGSTASNDLHTADLPPKHLSGRFIFML